ncbi:hypothetical protein ASG93_31285 [Paenibacillus sp. Soil787]|nr:hypothetical protein ASG93_31285 [Paenibacillus sp. Soil787]
MIFIETLNLLKYELIIIISALILIFLLKRKLNLNFKASLFVLLPLLLVVFAISNKYFYLKANNVFP